jgi:hypothetical protein
MSALKRRGQGQWQHDLPAGELEAEVTGLVAEMHFEVGRDCLRVVLRSAPVRPDLLDPAQHLRGGRGVGRRDLALLFLPDQTPRGTSSASWA